MPHHALARVLGRAPLYTARTRSADQGYGGVFLWICPVARRNL